MLKNFTNVYYSKVDNLDVEKVISFLPKARVEKINRLEDEHAQKLSAGVHLLLINSLRELGIKADDYEYKYDSNGKPILERCPLYFSLSHSGDYVSVAISDTPVGADIEIMRDVNFDIRRYVFTEKDEQEFKHCKNELICFYEKWTKKEAQYKLDGRPFKGDYDDPCYNIKIGENIMLAVAPNKPTEIKEM